MDFYYDASKRPAGTRIALEEFMNFEEDTYDVLGSVFLRELHTLGQESEHKVMNEIERFDFVAWSQMGSSDYWWLIMEYNAYINFTIENEEKYKIPRKADINRLKQKISITKNVNSMG